MIKELIINCPCCNKQNMVQISFSQGTNDVNVIGVFPYRKEASNIKEQKKLQEELFKKHNILLGEGV